jgi:NADH-quinone oxidoreductase subunit L
VMTGPLVVLALFAMALGVVGTPAWPWFRAFLENHAAEVDMHAFAEPAWLMLLLTSCVIVAIGIGLGWWLYGNKSPRAEEPDSLEKAMPPVWNVLANRIYVDELYGVTVIAFYYWWAKVADWFDRNIWGGIVAGITLLFKGWAQLNRFLDTNMVDGGFDKGCEELSNGGGILARVQNGRGQIYLRLLAVAVVILAAILIWSGRQ